MENQPNPPLASAPQADLSKPELPPHKAIPRLVILLILLLILSFVAYVAFSFGMQYRNYPTASPLGSPKPSAKAASPSPVDETAGWKTYTDTVNKFTLKYPQDWFLGESPYTRLQNFDSKTAAPRDYDPVADKGKYTVVIYPFKSEKQITTIDQLIPEIQNSVTCKSGSLVLSDKKVSIINGYQMLYQVFNCPNDTPASTEPIAYFLNGNGKVIQVALTFDVNAGNAIFDQILSTFQFTDQNSSLKTYYFPILDITFQYPSDWILKTGSYTGDIALDGSGACDYIKTSFTGYLRNADTCLDATIKSFSPGLSITSPDGQNTIVFAGPTSGLGGGCDPSDCPPNPPRNFVVNGRPYTINTNAIPSSSIKFRTLFGPQPVGILTGAKSVWNKFDIYLVASNQTNFDTEIAILESIK